MARSNIDHPSAPFAYEPPASEEVNLPSRTNALLVGLAALLDSHPGNVLNVLPHLSPDTPSSVCPSHTAQRLPQRKLLDTLASLIAFHPHCLDAAVALEATPDRVGLYISAATNHSSPARDGSGPKKAPSPEDLELRADFETWFSLVRGIRGRIPPSSKTLSNAGVDDTDVMDLPETQLTIAIFRACYATLRTRLRALPLSNLLHKFERCAPNLALVNLANLCWHGAHEEALGSLCEHLEVLVRLTDVEDAVEIEDARHFVALHVAGGFVARALRDEGFRMFLTGIDCETVEIVEQACLLSHLVTTLINTAKSSGMKAALTLPWRVEWIIPPPAPSSFEATIDLPLLQEWLRGIAWQASPFLDRPPDVATWPYSQVVGEILRDSPCGLVHGTSRSLAGDSEDSVGRHHYTVPARTENPLLMAASHCEMALLRYLADPGSEVLAYPYIATSHVSCYACAMLARAVGVVRGHEGEFMLRACEPRVALPWISELGLLDNGVAGWGTDVGRALEEGLLADLRSLVVDRAEQLVEGRDAGVFESIPGMLDELLVWGK